MGFKSLLHKVAAVASVVSIIPGPIGAAAAGISAAAYAGSGDWKNAAIMTATIALSMAGAGAVGLIAKGAAVAARASKFTATVEKAANGAKVLKNVSGRMPAILKASRAGDRLFNMRGVGAKSRIFGDIYSGAKAPGLLNRGKKWAIGWSADSVKKALPHVKGITKSMNASRTVFRIKLAGRHLPVFYGPWRGGKSFL